MGLKLVTAPAEEPVSLAEAKAHVRQDLDADDALLTALIVAARETVESRLKRALVTQTWDLLLDAFPARPGSWPPASVGHRYAWEPAIRLPMPPLVSVTSVSYVDLAGDTQALASGTDYQVVSGERNRPGLVAPAPGTSWPTAREQPAAVTVRFVAGYGDAAAVPVAIRQAMMLLIGNWYANREAIITGTIATELPLAVRALLAAHEWGHYS